MVLIKLMLWRLRHWLACVRRWEEGLVEPPLIRANHLQRVGIQWHIHVWIESVSQQVDVPNR